MKKSIIGHFAIIVGGLVLSLQLYGLKFIQGVEIQTGSYHTNAMSYFDSTPIFQSFLITCSVIVYGIILINNERFKILITKMFKY